MRAGTLIEIITFYKPEIVKTDTGSEDTIYVEYHQCRARQTYNSGNRENLNGDIFFSSNVVFEIRQGLVLDELYRIKWKDNFYRILSIEYNKPNQSIKIVCEKIND